MRENSQGSNQGGLVHSQQTNSKAMVNKFINPQKMPMNTNQIKQRHSYVHRLSGGAPIENQNRVNELLLESQKMIYAPPSREKTKQTMRSPLLEKAKAGGETVPADEYAMAANNTLYQG